MSVRGLIIIVCLSFCLSDIPAGAQAFVLLVDDHSSDVSMVNSAPVIEAPADLTLPSEITLRFKNNTLVADNDEFDLERAILNRLGLIAFRSDSTIEESFITFRVHTLEESYDLSAKELNVRNANLIVTGERYKWKELYDSSRSVAAMTQDEPSVDEFVSVQREPEFDYARLGSLVHYPDLARRANLEGQVLVAALISEEGHVVKAMIIESESPILQPYALRAVVLTEFTPAVADNKPVKVWVRIPIRFSLK